MVLTVEKAKAVYEILIEVCAANAREKDDFVYHHTKSDCNEWRFQGNLGFGGKYWSGRNAVSCYPEHLTVEAEQIIKKANKMLSEINF